MKFRALLPFLALGMGVIAHGVAASATLLEVRESMIVAASPERVWKAVRNFDNLGWHPAVATTQLIAGRNNEQQAIRLLVLKDGAKMTEQLRAHDETRRTQQYTLLESPLPVADYEASIAVAPGEGGGSLVTWQAHFYRKGDATVSDAEVTKMIGGIFAAGLGNLKQLLEAAPQAAKNPL